MARKKRPPQSIRRSTVNNRRVYISRKTVEATPEDAIRLAKDCSVLGLSSEAWNLIVESFDHADRGALRTAGEALRVGKGKSSKAETVKEGTCTP